MNATRRHRRSFNEPGHAHELTFSCVRGYPFLSKERTCQWLADATDAARVTLRFSLWAYVFMPNHVHLIVHFPRHPYEISELLQAVKQPVSRKAIAYLRAQSPEWLPRIEQRRGSRTEYHFWQRGGGYDRNITDAATLEQMIDYIHMNPVRKGLVERGIDWRWSSARWFCGMGDCPLRLDPIPPEWTLGMRPT